MIGVSSGLITEIVLTKAIHIGAVVRITRLCQTLTGFGVRFVLLGTDMGVPCGQGRAAVNPATVDSAETDMVIVHDFQHAGPLVLIQFGHTHGGGELAPKTTSAYTIVGG